jgi:hypothetical protein
MFETRPPGSLQPGRVLPAEAATKTSAPSASSQTSSPSLQGESPGRLPQFGPIEKLMTSTRSAIAFSMPAVIAASVQPVIGHTLYVRTCAHGATPDMNACCGGIVGGGFALPSMRLPAAVLAVCTPCPLPGSASGSGPLQTPFASVVVQSASLSSFGFAALNPHAASFANDGCALLAPVSTAPTTTPSPRLPSPPGTALPSQTDCAPMNSGPRYVSSTKLRDARTDATPGTRATREASSAVSAAATPFIVIAYACVTASVRPSACEITAMCAARRSPRYVSYARADAERVSSLRDCVDAAAVAGMPCVPPA